jgi:hypothetical protein
MPKVRVLQKQLKKHIGESEDGSPSLADMFAQMTGEKECAKELILPKYAKMCSLIKNTISVLEQFGGFVGIKTDFPSLVPDLEEFTMYAQSLKQIPIDIPIEEKSDAEVCDEYKKLKDHQFVKQLITICSQLKKYAHDFDEMKDAFIPQYPGLTLQLFPFSKLDFKGLWIQINEKNKPVIKKYVLSVIKKIYHNIYEIYEISTSPNVNVEEFSKVMLEAIQKLKTVPELHRCKKAFKKIENSVELLKSNFQTYYRDSISSQNPTIILENFILDVCKNNKTDAESVREFKVLVGYISKVAEKSNKKDPKVKKLLSMLKANLDVMNTKTKAPEEEEDIDVSLSENAE